MKNKYIIIALSLFIFGACTDKFEEYNTDRKNPPAVPAESTFTYALLELSDQISSTNVNLNVWKLWSQYWTEVTYTDEANYDILNRTVADLVFRQLYRNVLKNMSEASAALALEEPILDEEIAVRENKQAVIEIIEVYTYQRLIDIFGNIPYSEAITDSILAPVFDDAFGLYQVLAVKLQSAVTVLEASASTDSWGDADVVYAGENAAWIKFGYGLAVKMGISIIDHNAAMAGQMIAAAEAKALASSADDALLDYASSYPNTNTLYEDLVLSGRQDFVAANTLVDIMSELSDPRMEFYFGPKLVHVFPTNDNNARQTDTLLVDKHVLFFYNDSTQALVYPDSIPTPDGENVFGIIIPQVDTILEPSYYLGGPYGYPSPYADYSHVGEVFHDPTFNGILMTYSELLFYYAEAVEKGVALSLTAEEYYNEAITESVMWWAAQYDKDGTMMAAEYLANPDVAYTTAEGTFKQKIGTQSWLGSYSRGFIGYTTWRRLDYPIFNLAEQADTHADIPVRFTYPVYEQTLNAPNYQAASDAIGDDLLTTPLFWDKFPVTTPTP